MIPPGRRPGLRSAITATFVVGALLLATVLALGTWTAASQIMLRQRLSLSERQAQNSAYEYLSGLSTGLSPAQALDKLDVVPTTVRTLRTATGWVVNQPGPASANFQSTEFANGQTSAWAETPDGARATLVRLELANGDTLYELTETTELNGALTTLAQVLAAAGLVTALLGAAIGQIVVRRVLTPLRNIGQTAERIRIGELTQRLVGSSDPDLAPIVGSFNSMVAALDERIQRDARFAADVSHELRSPLTTLVASVDLLQRRRSTLDERSRATLDLMSRELDRFRTVLEDLIDLGRLEADAGWAPELTDLGKCAGQALTSLGVDQARLQADGPPILVVADPRALERAISNLIRNAELHGHGLRRITVTANAAEGIVRVHDAGPGIAPQDQSRMFDRFVRGGTRGDRPGSGLGLSIVRETMIRAGGSVDYRDSPLGGALFELRVPLGDADAHPCTAGD